MEPVGVQGTDPGSLQWYCNVVLLMQEPFLHGAGVVAPAGRRTVPEAEGLPAEAAAQESDGQPTAPAPLPFSWSPQRPSRGPPSSRSPLPPCVQFPRGRPLWRRGHGAVTLPREAEPGGGRKDCRTTADP
jgi:hypothetical protein